MAHRNPVSTGKSIATVKNRQQIAITGGLLGPPMLIVFCSKIHELLRQYGNEALALTGQESTTLEVHAIYYASLLKHCWEDLQGYRQLEVLADIDKEYENVRLAWQWLVDHKRLRELGEAANSLWFYLDVYSKYYEGQSLFEQATKPYDVIDNIHVNYWIIGHLWGRLAWFQGSVGLVSQYRDTARKAFVLLKDMQHPEEAAMALFSIGRWSLDFAQYEDILAVLKIGDFSRLSQVTVNTLRHYDQIGLLKPAEIDRFTGYRYYTLEQLPEIHRIMVLKELGLSLDQIIKVMIDSPTPDQLRGMLMLKQAELQQHIDQEMTRLARVKFHLRQIEMEPMMPQLDIRLKNIAPVRALTYRQIFPDHSEIERIGSALQSALREH
jgi:DNA-binding transcriptional MerR regulator